MTDWENIYERKIVGVAEAMHSIKNNDKIFVTGNASTPHPLLEGLAERAYELTNLEASMVLTFGDMPIAAPELAPHIRINSLFMGANVRDAVARGDADYTPVFLSEIPDMFRNDVRLRPDVALIQVSPPDEHGFCSFGCEVGITKPAAKVAKVVIAEVNEQMPRSLGDSFIHTNRITHMVPTNRPLPQVPQGKIDSTSEQIARHISQELIHDGDTLQMGIGAVADAVLNFLEDERDLGVHTELFSDGVVKLIDEGVITGEKKTLHPNKVVCGFYFGTDRLYRYIHNNPVFELHPTDYVNDPFVISQNENMVAINGAVEVDLTGQVCSDSIGQRFYSGIGGQVDFVRGAARSKNGRPIIALPSTTKNGTISRIVPTLKPGAGVVTSRGDVHYVVTEFGVAKLHGRPVRERAQALIKIAHPDHQDALTAYAKKHNII